MKTYLVEIRLKDWIHTDGSRTVCYEEVEAVDEHYACHIGYDQFKNKLKYSPIAHRKWEQSKLSLCDICAPAAVEID